ncbi:hypothetical protein ATN83_0789 [Raoultella ornithinolytica]|nr:hypothetical protein ATN83_0789 [Raoultella ornithinolytica]KDX12067.1 hypothetical protein AB28_4086 [Raoultella ornithinolytica 2-156-04_S1_C2]
MLRVGESIAKKRDISHGCVIGYTKVKKRNLLKFINFK